MENLELVIALLENREFTKAKQLLEDSLLANPKDVDALYNLGMCFTDLGEPEKSMRTLEQCIKHNPNYSNAYVAMGYTYSNMNNLDEAKKHLFKAIELDTGNSFALRNLGGIFGKEGDNYKALYYLDKSLEANPNDANALYGVAYTYMQLMDYANADKYFKQLLDAKASKHLIDKAKDCLREIATKNLKSSGFRADAMFYLLAAMKLFGNKTIEEVRHITFDIGFKGNDGLDINNPNKKYTINTLSGTFTGLQLVCYMYAGFKMIDSSLDAGIDLSEEYQVAKKLYNSTEII